MVQAQQITLAVSVGMRLLLLVVVEAGGSILGFTFLSDVLVLMGRCLLLLISLASGLRGLNMTAASLQLEKSSCVKFPDKDPSG